MNDTIDNPEHVENFKYYEIPDIKNLNRANENFKQLSLFHLNISSLPFHFEELTSVLDESKYKFDILGISESRLKLNSKIIQ